MVYPRLDQNCYLSSVRGDLFVDGIVGPQQEYDGEHDQVHEALHNNPISICNQENPY